MVKLLQIRPSKKKNKKYDAIYSDGKSVSFGAKGYSDYTIHKNPERKRRYLARHKKRENWTKSGMKTAGFLSRWILWNLPDLRASFLDTKKRFNI